MKALRFIFAFVELLVSPMMLILYGLNPPQATIRASRHQLLDFSPQLG